MADPLRRQDAAAFDVLARAPLDFRYHDGVEDFRSRAPAIRLGREGEIEEIRFNLSSLGALDVPVEQMDEVYGAYRKLAALIRDARYEVRLRLQPGDLVAIDNRRARCV